MRKINTTFISSVVVCIFVLMIIGCATGPGGYQAYITSEREFAGLADQYQMWYEGADPETQARLRESMDPLFKDVDILLDDYHDIMMAGGDPSDVAFRLRRIKTRILMELAKKNQ